jgi:predicted RNA binding protein YcfA (HicA-like mRNA interferase family)
MIYKLKNTPVRELIRAFEQDGFQYRRRKGNQRVYRHAKDTLPPGTLQSLLNGTKWKEDDIKRLALIT